MSLKVGDRVKVVDTGEMFTRYEKFLSICNVGEDVINKWSIGLVPKVNEEYNIIAIKPHKDNRYGLIAAIENEKGVFVIGINGLEKVATYDTKKGNFKIKCIKERNEILTKGKIYNFVDGVATWDDGVDSCYYINYNDFLNRNYILSDYFEEYIDEVQSDNSTSQVTEIKEFDWESFKGNSTKEIVCRNRKEAEACCKLMHEHGMLRCNDKSFLEDGYLDTTLKDNEHCVCYAGDGRYNNNTTTVNAIQISYEFSDYFSLEKDLNIKISEKEIKNKKEGDEKDMSKENTTDFTWKEFTSETNKGHMAVHCKTEKEAITFCNQMHKWNMKWIDGQDYLDYTQWTSDCSYCGIYYTNDGRYVTRNCYLDKEDIVFEFSDCFTSCGYIRAKQKKPLTRVESATTKTVQEVKETKEETKNLKIKESKEENIMKNNLVAIFGETVGKITDGMVAITFSGQVAIKRNEDEYVRFNAVTNTIENQMDFVMKEAEDFLFLLPVAEVQNGDVIKKNNTYYQVVGTGKQNGLSVVNIKSGTKKTLIKETNIMGFNFYFKVVNLFGDMGSVATSGMNPMLLPMLLSDNEEDEGILLPMLLCGGLSSFGGQQAQGTGMFGGMNPMTMALLMGDKKSGKGSGIDMKSIMMMSALGGQQAQGTGMNPMMIALMMGDGKMDAKTLMMMNLFEQQQAPVPPTQIAPVVNNTQEASTTIVTVPPVE